MPALRCIDVAHATSMRTHTHTSMWKGSQARSVPYKRLNLFKDALPGERRQQKYDWRRPSDIACKCVCQTSLAHLLVVIAIIICIIIVLI
mmetsp:Transcript_135114/g.350079  ORF Transcript_135114/g.350079 Transcript_135114/m.350079 type:complete len:90 (-) Transcript_135114:102-371(-)